MEKLQTPLGEIVVTIGHREIDYAYRSCEMDRTCPNLLGRYLIEVEFPPTGEEYEILCELQGDALYQTEIETGEMLECLSFYSKERIKLSIGGYGERWGYVDHQPVSIYTDYDIDYKPRGIAYIVGPTTKTTKYVFGISWIDDVGYDQPVRTGEHDRDVETWFGSDPSYLMRILHRGE